MEVFKAVLFRDGSSRRAAALPVKCKAKDTEKFALSLDLFTKFHNIIIFSTSDHGRPHKFFQGGGATSKFFLSFSVC